VDKIIADILGGIIMAIANIYMWHKLHNEKINFKNYKVYLVGIVLSIFLILNFYFINSYIKILTLIIIMTLCNYFLFPKEKNANIVVPIIGEFILIISEVIISILFFIMLKIEGNDLLTLYAGTVIGNFTIGLNSVLLVNLKIFKKITDKVTDVISNINKNILIIVLGILIIIINFLLAIPYYKIKTAYIIVFNAITIVVYSFIVFKMFEEKSRYIKMNNKYNMTNTTLKELEQNVTRLKITNHENKNQLLTIRNMIKKGEDGKSLIKHIENIVNTKIKDDETLMLQTSTITNSMISSIVYSKMLTMKENDVDAALIISRDIKDLYLSDIPDELAVEVCKIIGVYLDNALEEVSKYEEKIINIEFYAEKKTLCIAISNNFEGEIDFEKMDNPGYTTKENGHGYGLSLAREIIESNDRLSSEREIKDNIFKQILKIKM
jgi:two-component system sensor histidine kinase AgrC